jgi:NADPH:quinone reductase-like Zn-dependent oxidoreductase
MKALEFLDAAKDERLVEREHDRPKPGDGELLVRVRAAGIIPTERLWYPTLHAQQGEPRGNVIPAHEFAGEVVAVDTGSRSFTPGDLVVGMNGWFQQGALAEYTLTVPGSVTRLPKRLSFEQAASVPISALTAWQALYEKAGVREGERVLIHGAAGAVGLFAVQLAAIRGATVIATLAARDFASVREIGATQLIDYRTQRFEELVQPVDIVFDMVGGQTLERSWSVLKPGGRMVTVASSSSESPDTRARDAFLLMRPVAEQLAEIVAWLHAGRLKSFVKGLVPFGEASGVYSSTPSREGGGLGKIVVTIP